MSFVTFYKVSITNKVWGEGKAGHSSSLRNLGGWLATTGRLRSTVNALHNLYLGPSQLLTSYTYTSSTLNCLQLPLKTTLFHFSVHVLSVKDFSSLSTQQTSICPSRPGIYLSSPVRLPTFHLLTLLYTTMLLFQPSLGFKNKGLSSPLQGHYGISLAPSRPSTNTC